MGNFCVCAKNEKITYYQIYFSSNETVERKLTIGAYAWMSHVDETKEMNSSEILF